MPWVKHVNPFCQNGSVSVEWQLDYNPRVWKIEIKGSVDTSVRILATEYPFFQVELSDDE